MMNSIRMALVATTIFGGGIVLSGCTTIAPASLEQPPVQIQAEASKHTTVGGSYIINYYRGVPGNMAGAVHFVARDFDDIAYLEQVCRTIVVPQEPYSIRSVGVTAGFNTAEAVAGPVLGNAAINPKAALDLIAKGNAVSGATTGLIGGVLVNNRSKREEFGPCMGQQFFWAQKNAGRLVNMGVITDVDSSEGNPLSRPVDQPGQGHFVLPPPHGMRSSNDSLDTQGQAPAGANQ